MLTMSFVSCSAQAADSVEVAKAAPFVEKLVADGYEVLYLTEAIDEAMVTNLAKFNDLELVDVSKEGLQLDGGEDASKKVHRVTSIRCRLLLRSVGIHVAWWQVWQTEGLLLLATLTHLGYFCNVPRPTDQPHSSAFCMRQGRAGQYQWPCVWDCIALTLTSQ